MNATQGPDQRPLIFISHVSEEGEAARVLQADLDDRFIGSVRFFNTSSSDSLQPGESWLESTMRRLKESRIVLPILSPAALRSPWVNFEAGGGWTNGATVIPCCGGQARKESLPSPYSWLQAVDLDSEQDLERLVRRIADEVGLRTRTDGLADLAERMKSVFALGVVEATPSGMSLGNRIEKYVEVQWRYRIAAHDPTRWAATYYIKRHVLVTDPVMESVQIDFSPAIEAVPFTRDRAPVPQLGSWRRSSAGTVRLAEPHRRTGSSYAFRIYFDPPLRKGDEAHFELTIDFPEYRLGIQEDFIMAQLEQGRITKILDYQQNTRVISRPTEEFVYRVIIPVELMAVPADPAVTRHDTTFIDEEDFLRSNPSVYSVREAEHEGEQCWIMEVRRENPPYRAFYKIRWKLPGRKELGLDGRNGL